ncbi:MAG: hypothetical protein ABIR18_02410, partial [Chitinophagaceae bacterium]
MKQILILTLLLTNLKVFSQKNTVPVIDTSKAIYIATAAGQPDGEKTEAKIGKDGGSLKSSDNRIELFFPAGALSANKTISIQPVTNLAQGGIGKGYRMEPSGIQFNQPVKLVYHYTDTETEGDSPELMGLATQDDKGFWHQLSKIETDTTAKTITGNIKHFSLYNPQWRILLQPRYPRMKVSKENRIILAIAPKENGNPEPGEISQAFDFVFGDIGEFRNKWYVNGVLNGSAAVGYMSNQTFQSEMYKAPAQVPNNNPVKISVEIYSFNTVTSKPFRKSCNVLIYDNAYIVNMISTMQDGNIGKWGGHTTYKDEGSFVVSMEKNKPTIVTFENKLETLTDNCVKTILNPTTCTGLLHITGVHLIRVTPANPPGQLYPIVEVSFVQKRAEFTKYTYN